MRRIEKIEMPSIQRNTIIETTPVAVENVEIFRSTPFEFNITGDSINSTETIGRVFIVGRSDRWMS